MPEPAADLDALTEELQDSVQQFKIRQEAAPSPLTRSLPKNQLPLRG